MNAPVRGKRMRPDVAGHLEALGQLRQTPLKREPEVEAALAGPTTGHNQGLLRLAVAELRFLPDQQPRDMLPEESWRELLATSSNDPAGALAALRAAAKPENGREGRSSTRRVLEHVNELAESIRSDGVLVPLIVVRRGSEHVVLDGHCRAMACVVASVEDLPARLEDIEADGIQAELTEAAHRFVLNWTQRRLSPLEAARQLQRLVDIASRVVRAQLGIEQSPADPAPTEAVEEAAWVAAVASDLQPVDKLQPGQTRAQEVESQVRRLVLARTGLSLHQYFALRRLNNLNPDAWELADTLSEGHLGAIVSAPRHLHRLLVELVQAANASVKEAKAYARAAREQGEEYLQARLELLRNQRDDLPRRRTAVSWEPLLRAIPDDLTPRLSALRAELEALDDTRRDVRLRAILRQYHLLQETARAFEEILTLHNVPPTTNLPTDEGST